MIFTKNLQEIIFNRHEHVRGADELTVLSGYVGPAPVQRLAELPFRSKVIYGMYGSEGIKPFLHNSLLSAQKSAGNVSIFYSKIPIHAKCYAWHLNGKVAYALIGSANFSANGLNTPHREILAETNRDSFAELGDYIQRALNNSVSCLEAEATEPPTKRPHLGMPCHLPLVGKNGEIQNAAGLNWGQNPKNKTTLSDAYIPIRAEHIRNFPLLFLPKQKAPSSPDGRGRPHRHNDPIDIVWDDGINMEGLFTGNQEVDGESYPKQVTSFPKGQIMGLYLRKRLGVPPEQPVRKHHLERYGRIDIKITLMGEGIYYFDFSKPKS